MRISDWSSDGCSSDLSIQAGDLNLALRSLEQHDLDLAERTDPLVLGLALGGTAQGEHSEARGLLGQLLQAAPRETQRHRVGHARALELGRATCRERVCPYGQISGVAVYLKKKN